MIGALAVTHGQLAHELVAAAEMIVGEISHGADTTDADGRFVVPYQRIGNTRISVRAEGYATIFREVDEEVREALMPFGRGPFEGRPRRETWRTTS